MEFSERQGGWNTGVKGQLRELVVLVVGGSETRKVVWDSTRKDLGCRVLKHHQILMGT